MPTGSAPLSWPKEARRCSHAAVRRPARFNIIASSIGTDFIGASKESFARLTSQGVRRRRRQMRSPIELLQPIRDLSREGSDVGAETLDRRISTISLPSHHQDTAFDKSTVSGCNGIRTVNVEPRPTSLQTDTRPFNISVNDLTIYRPRPTPSKLRVVELST